MEKQLKLTERKTEMKNSNFDPIMAINAGVIDNDMQGSCRGRSNAKTKETVLVGVSVRAKCKPAVQVVLTADVYEALGTERVKVSINDRFVILVQADEGGLKLFDNDNKPPFRVKVTINGNLLNKNLKTTAVAPAECSYMFHVNKGVKYLIIEAPHIFTGTF